jgi:hypothetical protein
MTDNSLTRYAPPQAMTRPAAFSPWAPGQWLVRRLGLRWQLAAPLLAAWLPLLLALPWLVDGAVPLRDAPTLGALHDFALRVGAPAWLPWGMLAAGGAASLYLALCVGRTWRDAVQRLQQGALHLVERAEGKPGPAEQPAADGELGRALAALAAAGTAMARLRDAALHGDAVVRRSERELDAAQRALQLQALELRAAIGEAARRTIALCGLLDSGQQDAERASADLDAIHDEELHSLQLMGSLRSRLMALAQHCQALAEAAKRAAEPDGQRAGAVDELAAAVAAELADCHQLSERVGGAERNNERRIVSMRRSAERVVCRAERGLREGQQLMLLSRQAEAALTTTLHRLEQMTASCEALRALVEPPVEALSDAPSVATAAMAADPVTA